MGKILITGAAGYIGSVLTRQLLERGDAVRGLDSLLFGGEGLVGAAGHPRFEFVRGDVRDPAVVAAALEGIEAIVHLAAIVGDPACKAQPELTRSTNRDGTLALYESAARAGVERFVFASTCSNYGRMEPGGFVKEDSQLNPVSLYAETKVEVEQALLGEAGSRAPCTTVLRFATVYGISPRMRFDLTVNEFTRQVALGRELLIFGEQFWRPYCHVDDLARACGVALSADRARVDREVFGVGDSAENYQKQMIADELQRQVPSASIKYVERDDDPRDYRVDFSKIREELGFEITKTVPQGIAEIRRLLEAGLLADPWSSAYSNT